MKPPSDRTLITILTAAVAFLYIGGAVLISHTVGQSDSIRTGLVKGCEQNGNPLRLAVRDVLQDQVDQSRSGNLERFFPQIPPERLAALIRDANVQRLEAIRSLAPVDCDALYSK